jgi:predicted PurR-regulated permease PerM
VSALSAARVRFAPVLTATVITVLLLMLVGRTADLFLLLFLGILISLYLGAVADIVSRRTRIPRGTAFWLGVLGTVLAAVGLVWLLVPPVVQQTRALITILPEYLVEWERGINAFVSRFPELYAMWQPGEHRVLLAVYEQVSGYFSDLVPKFFSVLHALIELFSVLIMGLYLALDPGTYREFLISLFPPVHRDLVRNVVMDLASTLRSWIVGQLLAMLILGALTAAGLYLLKVPYWLTFGVFTGAVAIVPFFGTLVSTILPALFVLAGPGIWGLGAFSHALLVALLGVVVHVFEGNVVAPKIWEGYLHLPPVLTIMSVLIMGKLLGAVGLLVAVPTVAVLMVVVRRILINRIYEGTGFRRTVRDSALVVRTPAPEGGVLVGASPPLDILSIAEASQRRVA